MQAMLLTHLHHFRLQVFQISFRQMMLVTGAAVDVPLHVGFFLHIQFSYTVENDMDMDIAAFVMTIYWDEVLRGEEPLSTAGNDAFYFSTERFTIGAGSEDIQIYSCDVCGKTTMVNCKGMCTTLKCGGHLRQITHARLLENNHYAKLYRSSLMQPLHIKEHTAQLGREEQQKYQEMFVNKDINALSCSTTFEMGVDVGDLETV